MVLASWFALVEPVEEARERARLVEVADAVEARVGPQRPAQARVVVAQRAEVELLDPAARVVEQRELVQQRRLQLERWAGFQRLPRAQPCERRREPRPSSTARRTSPRGRDPRRGSPPRGRPCAAPRAPASSASSVLDRRRPETCSSLSTQALNPGTSSTANALSGRHVGKTRVSGSFRCREHRVVLERVGRDRRSCTRRPRGTARAGPSW